MILLLAALLAASADEPAALKLRVGEKIAICKAGNIQCPATSPNCDDTSIAGIEDSPDGLVFRGLKPGTTLCSVASGGGLGPRRVYRITVTPP